MVLYFCEFLNADGFASSLGATQFEISQPVPHFGIDAFFLQMASLAA
jgi:hypothetical protein